MYDTVTYVDNKTSGTIVEVHVAEDQETGSTANYTYTYNIEYGDGTDDDAFFVEEEKLKPLVIDPRNWENAGGRNTKKFTRSSKWEKNKSTRLYNADTKEYYCGTSGCNRKFKRWYRLLNLEKSEKRHHCRYCGSVACANCLEENDKGYTWRCKDESRCKTITEYWKRTLHNYLRFR